MPQDFAGVMHEFKGRLLHSGSKTGPVVTDPRQAKAIAISEQQKMTGPAARASRAVRGIRGQ